MTKTFKNLAVTSLFIAVVACGRDEAERKDQQNYETVQEGQAAGVTSTIHGPGETLPPMTGTNADTTSAFTIDPALATGPATPPGTLAGALPQQPYGGTSSPGYYPTPGSPRPTQVQPRPAQPQHGDTTFRDQPAQPQPSTTTMTTTQPTTASPQPETPPAETAPPPPPTQTDTSAPAPPPPAQEQEKPKEEKPKEEKKEEPAPPETPPPPPPA